jgi:hypothetical protein
MDRELGDPVAEEQERIAGWQRDSQSEYLREAVALEPDLLKIFELARRSQRVEGYHRIRRYYDLKRFVTLLVGFDGRQEDLATTTHFDAVRRAMVNMLPGDRGDNPDLRIYPGEDEVQNILATRPVLAREPGFKSYTAAEVLDPNSEINKKEEAQAQSDLAWLAGLHITVHPMLAIM